MRHRSRTRVFTSGPPGAVGQRLRRLTEWAVASCLTAAVGCGQEAPGHLQQRLAGAAGQWHSAACADLLLVTDPVRPAQAFDYLAVFNRGGSDGRQSTLLSDYGTACKGARDRAACAVTLNQQVRTAPLLPAGTLGFSAFAVMTTGDAVERLDDAPSLARVLGPIDTDSEAVLLAQLSGLSLSCAPPSFSPNASQEAGTRVQPTAAGYRVKSVFGSCGAIHGTQQLEVHEDGTVSEFEKNELEQSACAIGRRPEGLVLNVASGCEPLARLLAECAQLEAASVPAFLRLAHELQGLGAHGLAYAARRSAQDEVRHTRQMRRLAARYGGRPIGPRVQDPARARGAYEIARDNAVEGCVRETYGALLAWQQAATARDPEVAETMREIAADETRHAELSWQIAEWLEPRLAGHERAALDKARSQALAQLAREIAADPLPDRARAEIGWPSAAQQQALLQRMATELALS